MPRRLAPECAKELDGSEVANDLADQLLGFGWDSALRHHEGIVALAYADG